MYNTNIMGSYYYIEDSDSETGYTPIPEDNYIEAILKIAKRNGVKIAPKMILEEVAKENKL